MAILTIIVVAILTCLIFGLATVAFVYALRDEKRAIDAGERDEELLREKRRREKRSSKASDAVSLSISALLLIAAIAASSVAISYRASGQRFSVDGKVGLVIASDSMDGFYDAEYASTLPDGAGASQFAAGDLVGFDEVPEDAPLEIYGVYGYALPSGKVITHRLIGETDSGKLIFRGDNAAGRDSYVDRGQVSLRYNGFRLRKVGFFVLFSQSGFGLYSLISVMGVHTIADAFLIKYRKTAKDRLRRISGDEE